MTDHRVSFIVGLRLEASESVVIMILRLIILVTGSRRHD